MDGAINHLHKNSKEQLRIFNRIVANKASRGLDGYYWVNLQELIDLNAEVGIEVKGLMNTTFQQLSPDYGEENILEIPNGFPPTDLFSQ